MHKCTHMHMQYTHVCRHEQKGTHTHMQYMHMPAYAGMNKGTHTHMQYIHVQACNTK